MSYQLKLAAGFAIGALLLLAAEIRYGLRGAGNLVLACLAGLAAGQLAPEHYWALFGAAGTLVLLLCTWSSAELKGVARNLARAVPGASSLIGGSGVVVDRIEPARNSGSVEFGGLVWRAIATHPIGSGTPVRLTGVEGDSATVEEDTL